MARSLIKVCGDALGRAYHDDPQELASEVEAKIFKLSSEHGRKDEIPTIGQLSEPIIKALIERQDIGQWISTGFDVIDRITGGLHAWEVIVIAGRPSMGKTALTLNIAEHAAFVENLPVLIFSVEMTAENIVHRFLIKGSGVDSVQLRSGLLGDSEISQLCAAHQDYADAPLYLDCSSYQTPLKILAQARHLVYRAGIKLIVIDYAQLVKAPRGIESGYPAMTYISAEIKRMAKEIYVPIILVSQLNRAPEGRAGHRPQMSDLKESGGFEQDADVVMLLYREDYYKGINEVCTNIGEVNIAKQR